MKLLAAALISLLASQYFAYAQTQQPNLPRAFERVETDVSIERNGDVEVLIKFTMRVDGHQSVGLAMPFPLRGDPCANPPRFSSATVLSVTRNGKPEKYSVERSPASAQTPTHLRVGVKGQYLPDGDHIFVIRYRVRGQVRISGALDELHWVVARGEVVIKSAIARLKMPDGVDFEGVALFTGNYGAIGDGARVVERSFGLLVVEADRALNPKEGVTAIVSWKKGIVNLPPVTEAEIAAAQKQQKQAKEFNCLTSSIKILNLAEVLPTDFSIWN